MPSTTRIVYSAAQPLASVSQNCQQRDSASKGRGSQPKSNRRHGTGGRKPKPAGVCTAGESRHSRHSRPKRGCSPRGATTKRRSHTRRQLTASGDATVPNPSAPTVEQLSLLLAASQLGGAAPVHAGLSSHFTLTALTAEEEDSDDECCGEMDSYTAAARGIVPSTNASTSHEEGVAEDMMLAAALAQNFQATDTLLNEHAAQHQTMIVERWRAQQQLAQQQKQQERQQQEQLSPGRTTHNTTTCTAPIKLVFKDGAGEDEELDAPPRDSFSPVSVAPDSPGESQPMPSSREVILDPAAERKVQAAELKEQGQALMAAGDYLNGAACFGIAKGLDPGDEELPGLEEQADSQAASAARAAAPSTCASEYARMYEAWLSLGTSEIHDTGQMAVC